MDLIRLNKAVPFHGVPSLQVPWINRSRVALHEQPVAESSTKGLPNTGRATSVYKLSQPNDGVHT
jgi:hypothetical protein